MKDKKVTAAPASVGKSTNNDNEINRRGFFTVIIRFLYPNVLFEPPQSLKLAFQKILLLTLSMCVLKKSLMFG